LSFEGKLLKALDNKNVQQKICEIVRASKESALPSVEISNKEKCNNNQITRYEAGQYTKAGQHHKDVNVAQVNIGSVQAEIRKLKTENAELTEKLEESQATIASLNGTIEQKETANAKLAKDLRNSQATIASLNGTIEQKEKKLKALEPLTVFQKPLKLLTAYRNLPEKIHYSLSNILAAKSLEAFVATGVQYDNLKSLWEFMKDKALDDQKIPELLDIFRYFLEAYNANYEKPRYQILPDFCGENFDNELHIRGYNSRPSGRITETVLPGYKNTFTGKIEKKSVVIVK